MRTEEAKIPEKAKVFFSEDHCQICGFFFLPGDRAYCMQTDEVQKNGTTKEFIIHVHLDCLMRVGKH